MKKKLILIPITLTALSPTISLVGCGGDTPEPPEPTGESFESCSWSYINDKATALENATITQQDFCASFTIKGKTPESMADFIGVERTATINNVKHRVRVVDEEHDVIVDADNDPTNDTFATLTFEFADAISDEKGGLASFWNDTESSIANNFNYLNSTLRYNLTKLGTGNAHKNHTGTQWYGCDSDGNSQTTHRSEFENTSVLDMIQTGEPELYDALKSTKQYVATTTTDWSSGITTDTEYHDKVFLANAYCYGYKDEWAIETIPTPYKYYEYENEMSDKDGGRLKHAVGITDETAKESISNITDALYTATTYNFAGYTIKNTDSRFKKERLGANFWLSSPYTDFDYGSAQAWSITNVGNEYGANGTNEYALCVAPCFCI